MAKGKVLLGMSGGVDSAVSAYLLKKQGYEVTCCFMRNWDSIANSDILGNPTLNGNKCSQEMDYDDATDAALELELPIIRKDFIDEYWNEVFNLFLDTYKKGYTPDADVFCNKYIKFGHFIKFAKDNGFEQIAMGHYAMRIDENKESHLYKAFDKNKDQSYFLGQLTSDQVAMSLFPLASLTKAEVRSIAIKANLTSVMNKKDSTGICFIGERNFKQFLNNYLPSKEGNIVDIVTNTIVGKHTGVLYYTVGQHKGLNVGGIKGRENLPFFVVGKDVKKNILYVAQEKDNKYRFSSKCLLKSFNWIGSDIPQDELKCKCKFRYRGEDKDVLLKIIDANQAYLIYDNYSYVTKGQIASLYLGERLLGSGVIEAIYDDSDNIIRY